MVTSSNPESGASEEPKGKEAALTAKRYIAEARRNLTADDRRVDKSEPQTKRASDNLQFLEGFVNGMPVADLARDKIVIAQRIRPEIVVGYGKPFQLPIIQRGEIYVAPNRQVMYEKDPSTDPEPLNQGTLPGLLEKDRKLYERFADMSRDAILARVEKGIK